MPRSKVNPRPVSDRVSPEALETIRAYNWLDAELYEPLPAVQEQREAELLAAGAR